MRKTIGKLFLILMLLVIYAPILILAVYSFTDSGNIGSIHGFSMQNYVTLFTKGELRDMIVGTVLLALVSSLLATILVRFIRRNLRRTLLTQPTRFRLSMQML